MASLYPYCIVMGSLQQGVQVLQEAEGRLRDLMNEEIASHRYTNLPALASLADGLAALLGNVDAPSPDEALGEKSTALAQTATPAPNPRRSVSSSIGGTKSTKRTSKYPFFEVDEDWIGKVGWSKKNREEYRHYAPISAAFALAEHVDKTQKPSRVWTVEELGEVLDSEAGEALPSYQLYLVISWMRSVNLLMKQGRSGYVAVGGGKLLPGVKTTLKAA